MFGYCVLGMDTIHWSIVFWILKIVSFEYYKNGSGSSLVLPDPDGFGF